MATMLRRRSDASGRNGVQISDRTAQNSRTSAREARRARPATPQLVPGAGRAVEHGGENEEDDREGRQHHHGAPGEQGARGMAKNRIAEAETPQHGRGIGGRVGRDGKQAGHGGEQSAVERSDAESLMDECVRKL